MDVWFDSGTSWSTLKSSLQECATTNEPLADIYLKEAINIEAGFNPLC